MPGKWLHNLEQGGLSLAARTPRTKNTPPIGSLSTQARIRGGLIGGAVGDALGAAVEFDSLQEIVGKYGARGIRDFAPAYGMVGAITDDTQMALFTAEGVIRAYVRASSKGICAPESVVHHAYMRWLKTQGEAPERLGFDIDMDGWLIDLRPLWERRAPGATCLAALRDAPQFGSRARNDSKGCGTVMRAAPIGLALCPDARPDIFQFSIDVAALTHGHPTAALSAAFLAVLISHLVEGVALPEAIEAGRRHLITAPDNDETLAAIANAEKLAGVVRADSAAIERLGGGWTAEEALAIALYSVLTTSSFEDAVVLAVNHSGDSDSTGAIAGNIAGALYGTDAIPGRWLGSVELLDEITAVADDLLCVRLGTLDAEDQQTWSRYPGC